MPSPVYSAGTPGNVISNLAVTHGQAAAAFLDLSTVIEGQVTCEMVTGGTAPTAGTTFSFYHAYAAGASAPITISGTASGTSLPVNASANLAFLHANQKVAVVAASTGVGEVATLTAAPVGVGAQTLTCSTLINSYAASDKVYLMAQVASFPTTPANPVTGSWAAGTDYSSTLFLGASQWIVAANNTDATVATTVTVTVNKITAFQ